jgi:hypothetical protein
VIFKEQMHTSHGMRISSAALLSMSHIYGKLTNEKTIAFGEISQENQAQR